MHEVRRYLKLVCSSYFGLFFSFIRYKQSEFSRISLKFERLHFPCCLSPTILLLLFMRSTLYCHYMEGYTRARLPVGKSRVDWNHDWKTGRLKHSDSLENHAWLSRQISSLRSGRKTDQPSEISCKHVQPFKCYPPNLFSRALSKILPAVVFL